jgi:hypothetical protein
VITIAWKQRSSSPGARNEKPRPCPRRHFRGPGAANQLLQLVQYRTTDKPRLSVVFIHRQARRFSGLRLALSAAVMSRAGTDFSTGAATDARISDEADEATNADLCRRNSSANRADRNWPIPSRAPCSTCSQLRRCGCLSIDRCAIFNADGHQRPRAPVPYCSGMQAQHASDPRLRLACAP